MIKSLKVTFLMAQIPATNSYPKHNIHKFHDISPKLGCNNWISWKQELMATARDWGLYANILGTDILPTQNSPNTATLGSILQAGSTPLAQLINTWTDKYNTAYNQTLLCISPKLQTAIDTTDIASTTWKILTKKFKSTDPSKISIVRTWYNNYHMVEGQSVISYLTTMNEDRAQLDKMGEKIANSTHTATILRNLPELWWGISQMIRMITSNHDTIKEWLEAHEVDLSALEISTQAMTPFITRPKLNRPDTTRSIFQCVPPLRPDHTQQNTDQQLTQKPINHCDNCRKLGHPLSKCYASGGRLEGQAPWVMSQGQFCHNYNLIRSYHMPSQVPNQQATQLATPASPILAQLAPKSTEHVMAATIHYT